MAKNRVSGVKTVVSRWSAAAGFIAALLAVVFLILEVIKPRFSDWLSPVYNFQDTLSEVVPHYLFFLVLFALLAMIYYFLTNMAHRISLIDVVLSESRMGKHAEPQAHEARNPGVESGAREGKVVPPEKTKETDWKALVEELSRSPQLESELETLMDRLEDDKLSRLIERMAEKRPEFITPAFLDKLLESVKKRVQARVSAD